MAKAKPKEFHFRQTRRRWRPGASEFPMGNCLSSDPVVTKAKVYVQELTASSDCGYLLRALLVAISASRMSSGELLTFAAEAGLDKAECHKLRMVGSMLLPLCGGDEDFSRSVLDANSPWVIQTGLPETVKEKLGTTAKNKLLAMYTLHEAAPEEIGDFVSTHDVGKVKAKDMAATVNEYMQAKGIKRSTKGGPKPKKTKEALPSGVLKQLNATVLLMPDNAADIAKLYGDETVKKELIEERRIKSEHAIKAGLLLLDIGLNVAEVSGEAFAGEELASILELMASAARKLQAVKRGFNKVG